MLAVGIPRCGDHAGSRVEGVTVVALGAFPRVGTGLAQGVHGHALALHLSIVVSIRAFLASSVSI